MRMKFNKSGQLVLVSAASLLVAGLLTACGSTLTVDFVYVASSKAAGPNNYGEIDVMEVNSESGRMRAIATSPFPSGGRNPVAEAVSTDHNNLYVVNQDDNSIVQFAIGNDGKVYPQNTVNTPGVFPMAVAVTAANLFVADTYQPLPTCSPAQPCPGSIAVFPIAAATSSVAGGALQTGTPINACNGLDYLPLKVAGVPSTDVIAPAAIAVNGSNLFVAAYDMTANTGYVFGFVVGSLSCPNNPAPYTKIPTLTAMGASPLRVGTQPSAIATDPSGKFVYLTDYEQGKIYGLVAGGSGLSFIAGEPFAAGNEPSAVAVDPSGSFAFVANSLDSTISTYSLDSNSGVLAPVTGGTYATGTQPVALIVDPSTNHYVYTANYLGGTVSGFMLTSTGGPLVTTQGATYTTNAQPTAMAAIPHGTPAGK